MVNLILVGLIKEKVKKKSVIRVKKSIHVIENSTDKSAEFIVFRIILKDERLISKSFIFFFFVKKLKEKMKIQ